MKNSVQIKTFGCKLNHYDSLLIEKQLHRINWPKEKQIFILNSCAVTAQAGKEVRKKAKKLKEEQPDSFIAVTGCGAEVETKLYEQSPFFDLVIGNSEKKNLPQILQNFSNGEKNKVFKSNIFKSRFIPNDFISPGSERTRAFLKIQEGCDSFCTFCIIPFARGKSRSLPVEFLVKSIQKLEEQEVREVVLTGVHIGDYRDQDKNLDDLLVDLLNKTSIPRIRLSSLEPIEITDKLLDCYTDERMCPHFHLSLQSANSSVLKSMKRKYGRKDVEQAFQKISKKIPEAFIGMDVIVGFPSESKKDFQESYEVLKNHQWTNIHVFPYSSRKGTYAFFKYPALPQKEVNQRAKALREISQIRFNECLKKQKGTVKKTLLFKNNESSLSRDYWKIKVPPSQKKGEHLVKIQGIYKEKENWLKASFL